MNKAPNDTENDTLIRVLIVEDQAADAELMRQELARGRVQFATDLVDTESGFREALEQFDPHVILADYTLPRFSGMKVLQIVKELRLDIPVIVVTGSLSEDVAIECLQAGVSDYVLKENLLRLGSAVRIALETARLRHAGEVSFRRAEALAAIVEEAPNSVFVFSGEPLRFVYVNRVGLEGLGYELEEFLHLSPWDVKPGVGREQFEALLEPLRKGGTQSLTFRAIHRRKDETEYPVEVQIQPVEYMGEAAFACLVVDLEARTKAEDQAATLEMRLSQFANSTGDAMIASDADGLIVFWNRAATSIFGFSEEEMIGQPVRTLLAERFREAHDLRLKAAAGRTTELLEESAGRTMGLHKSGTEVPLEFRLGAWRQGEEDFFSMVAQDITDRVQSEQRLLAATEYYRAILEHLPVVTYEIGLDDDGAATKWLSPQLETLLGTPQEKWGGHQQEFVERVHPDDRARVDEAVSEGMAVGGLDIEYRIEHEDGHYLWVRDRAVVGPSMSKEGANVLRGVVIDVTAAKDSERERALLSTALEQSTNLVVITDTDGSIEYVNPAFEGITGYTRQEAIGKNPRLINSGRQSEAFYEEMWAHLTAGRSWTGDFVNRRKDGTEYDQRSSIFPIQDDDGRVRNFVSIAEDVSAKRELEQRLRQAQKMEAVGQLTGGIAHDFNNVLAAILTNAQLLAMEAPPESTGEGSELHDIEMAARSGADLIKKLMAFSRDEHLDLKVVDPSDLLAETVGLLKRVLPENITLTCDETHDGALIEVDQSGIQQVLTNLATNARDSMPEGGTLTLSTRVAAAATVPFAPGDDDWVQIVVGDSGTGIDPETLERIFEPFFTTKDRGKGTGLGLASVHKLVDRHGGIVNVDSEMGVGTTFTISLPVTREVVDLEESVPQQAAPTTHYGKTLLLVEDEEPLRRAGTRALQRAGYSVHVAEDGRGALEVLEAHQEDIALVITDLIMPEMGGQELYDATSGWNPRPAFLVTTGYGPREVAGEVLGGEVPVLRKPWNVTDLVEAVHGALEGLEEARPVTLS